MASELRLVLLAICVAGLLVLVLWERRRSRLPADPAAARGDGRFEPRLDGETRRDEFATDAAAPVLHELDFGAQAEPQLAAGFDATPAESPVSEPPALRPPPMEHPIPSGDPPVLTVEGLPDDPKDVVLSSPDESPKSLPADDAPRGLLGMRRRRRVANPPVVPAGPVVEPAAERARDAADVAEDAISLPPAAPPRRPTSTPRHQRIVAIRLLVRDGQRVEGRELRAALLAEGLEFGRHSIFHRVISGSRPLFSVASLVEPGSFDPARMEEMQFPGVSLFAVFPGSLPAPQCFDDMLGTARRLGDRIGAVLQDDTGSTLTGQRILSLREELVQFEHLNELGESQPPF